MAEAHLIRVIAPAPWACRHSERAWRQLLLAAVGRDEQDDLVASAYWSTRSQKHLKSPE